MKSFKALLLATACVAVMSTPALAAKAAAPAAAPAAEASGGWAGPYVGIQLGAGKATTELTDIDQWYSGTKDQGPSDTAFIGGAKIGYDMTEGSAIYGIFAEYSFSAMNTDEENGGPAGAEYKAGSDINGLGSIRAKLGMASGDVAGFVSAGLAYQNADEEYQETDGSGQYIPSHNSDQWGWAFGLGTEYAVGGNGFIGLDASHYIFGKNTYELLDSVGAGTGNFWSFENNVTTGTISYTYKFN
jgi:outer membrane immunogenic protein